MTKDVLCHLKIKVIIEYLNWNSLTSTLSLSLSVANTLLLSSDNQ